MSRRYRDGNVVYKVYVGNLGSSIGKQDIEAAFSKYGQLSNVWVACNPPGFAFVEFEDAQDAEDACRGLDGTDLCGSRVRVEMSHGRRGGGRRGGGGGGQSYNRYGGYDNRRSGYGGYNNRRSGRGRSRSPPPRRRYSPSGARSPRRRTSRSPSRDRRSRS